MTLPISVIFSLALGVVTLVIALGFYSVISIVRKNSQIEARLHTTTTGHTFPQRKARSRSQVLEALGSHLTLPEADKITRIRFTLTQAGFYHPASVQIYYAVRFIAIMIPLLLFLLLWSFLPAELEFTHIALIASSLCLAGFVLPDMIINRRRKSRKLQALNGFPDMMDLMVACVEAGLGLDAALLRVTDEIGGRYPVLKTNLDIMNAELRAGRGRYTALMNFADRLDLEETKTMAVMLKQAEDMGSSLGLALRTFSESMRTKRMLKAEEKAMALSAKLTVVLVMFIFPTLMVMLMLPAGIRIAEGFTS